MLPPEVLDNVFSFLCFDTTALRSCTIAFPEFARMMERHLYFHITVYNVIPEARYLEPGYNPSQLLELLSDNPRVANYARSLKIEMIADSGRELYPEAQISTILPQLHNLEKITLSARRYHHRLHEKFREAFLQCLRSSSTRDVTIRVAPRKTFPLSAFDRSKALKRLTINGSFEPDFTARSPFPVLESLVIENHDSLVGVVVWEKARNLRSLKVGVGTRESFKYVKRILDGCENSLNDLDLYVEGSYDTKYHIRGGGSVRPASRIPLDLSTFINLYTLTFRADLISNGDCYSSSTFHADLVSDTRFASGDCYSSLPAIARLAKTAPDLKQLVLVFDVNLLHLNSLYFFDWSPILKLVDIAPSCNIKLCISVRKLLFFPRNEVLPILEHNKHLSRLMDLGILTIEVVEEYRANWVIRL